MTILSTPHIHLKHFPTLSDSKVRENNVADVKEDGGKRQGR